MIGTVQIQTDKLQTRTFFTDVLYRLLPPYWKLRVPWDRRQLWNCRRSEKGEV